MQTILMERDLGIMTVQGGFDKFIRMKKLQKLSPETIEHYESCFRYFKGYFDPEQPCSIISKDTFYGYVEYLEERGTTNTITINTYLRGVRALFYYLIQEGYTKRSWLII